MKSLFTLLTLTSLTAFAAEPTQHFTCWTKNDAAKMAVTVDPENATCEIMDASGKKVVSTVKLEAYSSFPSDVIQAYKGKVGSKDVELVIDTDMLDVGHPGVATFDGVNYDCI